MYLNSLKSYVQSSNYLMETLDDFNKKIQIMADLWPQISNGKIKYLIGKGIGVELALRGNIDRENKNIDFSYRKHADLELYGVGDNYYNIEEAKNFHFVFGEQEIYKSMKSLRNVPETLLFDTATKVTYNNRDYYIPELELLFLDKFLRIEEIPRREGYDYLLLLQKYKLSLEKVLLYFDKYYLKPVLDAFEDGYKTLVSDQIKGLISLANMFASEGELENNHFDVKKIIKYINEKIEVMKQENISFFGLKGNLIEYNPPIKYIDEQFILDDKEYFEKINENVQVLKKNEERIFLDKKQEIVDIFNNVYN